MSSGTVAAGRWAPVPLADTCEPWERQPSEPARAYAQFTAYRDLGLRRTLTKAAENLTLSYGHTRNVAGRWRWQERAGAWDAENDRQYLAEFAEARRRAARADVALLSVMVGKVAAAMEHLNPAEMTAAEVARWADVSLRHRRALFGDPTAVVAVTGPGGEPLMGAEQQAWAGMSPGQRVNRLRELAAQADLRANALAEAAELES